MEQRTDSHVFTGLQQDIAISKQTPEHLIDAHNIRISAKQAETLFSLTNEKGPLLMQLIDSEGNEYTIPQAATIIGYCILNAYLVLFVKDTEDKILRVDMSKDIPVVKELFSGDLNFNVNYPIEALADYENGDIQKVYWTDGLNQPRLINIMHDTYSWEGAFDFSPELQLKETVDVTKESSSSGLFAPGTIQYVFTYYNKHGQETNPFYVTPLQYISYFDRGANPKDNVSNAFKITVDNIDNHFDYLRIYSIQRTSLNGTPICKRVQDIQTSKKTAIYSLTPTGNKVYNWYYPIVNADFSTLESLEGFTSIDTAAKKFSKTLLEDNIYYSGCHYKIINYASRIVNYLVPSSLTDDYVVYSPTPLEQLYLLNDKSILFLTDEDTFEVGDTVKFKLSKLNLTPEPVYIQTKVSGSYVNVRQVAFDTEESYTLQSTEDRLYAGVSDTLLSHDSDYDMQELEDGANMISDYTKSIEQQTPRYGKDEDGNVDTNLALRFGNATGTCAVSTGKTPKQIEYTNTPQGSDYSESEYTNLLVITKEDGANFVKGDTISLTVGSTVISDYNTGSSKTQYLGGTLYYRLATNGYSSKILASLSSGSSIGTLTYTFPEDSNASSVSLRICCDNLFTVTTKGVRTKYKEEIKTELSGVTVKYYSGHGEDEYLSILFNDLTYDTAYAYHKDYKYRPYKFINNEVFNIRLYPNTMSTDAIDDQIAGSEGSSSNNTFKLFSTTYEGTTYIFNKSNVYKQIHTITTEESSSEQTSITFVDTGNEGETIDATDLIYKAQNEKITAKNICSKDGTLFLGNLTLDRKSIRSITNIKYASTYLVPTTKHTYVKGTVVSDSYAYPYTNTLSTQAAGFKNREYYRLGYQAQYKDGRWSDPIWITDYQVNSEEFASTLELSKYKYGLIDKLLINCTIPKTITDALRNEGYKRIRPLVVFPEVQDRTILCQGIVNPTLSTEKNVTAGLNAQSSWFFRPLMQGVNNLDSYALSKYYSTSVCAPFSAEHGTKLIYTDKDSGWNPKAIRGAEIQGQFDDESKFYLNWEMLTFHSPEIEFDDTYKSIDFSDIKARIVGEAQFLNTFSTIDILTSTPTISDLGSGFVQQSFNTGYANGIVSGLFYDDFVTDDCDPSDEKWFKPYPNEVSPVKWLVYPWQKNGSLTNDATRDANGGGDRSAVLSKKVMSNLRTSDSVFFTSSKISGDILATTSTYRPQIFDSQEVSAVKVGTLIYEGNIDTLLAPDDSDGNYFCFSNGTAQKITDIEAATPFTSKTWFKTWAPRTVSSEKAGLYYWTSTIWKYVDENIGDYSVRLARKKEPVRMKYKSTPHLVMYTKYSFNPSETTTYPTLPIVELYRDYDYSIMFGGQTEDAFKANKWLPAGKPVNLQSTDIQLTYEYGDTWFSRYDCLKTYPYADADINQMVEIGSFALETRVNIDGRYDRNRGQVNNLNMSPTNFNLFNSVYSQPDNYYQYQILDEDYYTIDKYPTQLTWTLQKSAGADVDIWSSITLASTFDVDGTYGGVNALVNWANNLYCFQDSNLSTILFNSRVQIPTSEGAPIEITNNYKVDGKRDVINNVGCTNKYAISKTPLCLYFIDATTKHLMCLTGSGCSDVSMALNMATWYNKQDNSSWLPQEYSTKLFYDVKTKDLYTITKDTALSYSELLQQFVSFFSYGDTPYMFNVLDDSYIVHGNQIYRMFEGEYNEFFGQVEPYDYTFVSNGRSGNQDLSSIDKVFSNLEFRADKWADNLNDLTEEFPFDTFRAWDEYQDTGDVTMVYTHNFISNLKKKFRSWHFTIPRDMSNGRDRIRNTWCKVKLACNNPKSGEGMILHDTVMQYYV